jgi:hypothetical protein
MSDTPMASCQAGEGSVMILALALTRAAVMRGH